MQSPITGKEMKLESVPTELTYRGVKVLIPHVHFKDIDNDEEFTNEEQEDANIENTNVKYESVIVWKWAEKAFALGYLNQDFGDKDLLDILPKEIIPKWERCQQFLIDLGCPPKPYKK